MQDLQSALLTAHVACGAVALVTAAVAVGSKTLDVNHRWHVWSGRVYVLAMTGVLVTVIPLSIIKFNPFMLAVSLFSAGLVAGGVRTGTRRGQAPELLDWAWTGGLALVGLSMLGFGAYGVSGGQGHGITLVVFGGISISLGGGELRRMRRDGILRGKARVAQHLGLMMGATIGTITAFLVNNIQFDPAFVVWLAPTALITPIIIWWSRRLTAGHRPKGMPAPESP